MECKTIFVQQYPKYGYEVRTEIISYAKGTIPIELLSAYTNSGAFIGNPEDAEFLCKEKGIVPETIDTEHKVCSIGFCGAEKKWYGWDNRDISEDISGFCIGSSVKKDDCGYVPDNSEELAAEYAEWCSIGVDIIDDETVELDDYTIVKTGRGEWTARTLDDARQMAIDFANDVA